jgi:hypothetical protein
MFDISTMVQVNDVLQAFFWHNQWIDGCIIEQLPPPQLLQAVSKRTRKTRLVYDALTSE